MTRLFLGIGALAGALAVLLGAFATHTLAPRITPERLQTFETGARYQMYHALALLAVGWISANWPSWHITTAGYLFIAGILLFSGSLYTLVLTDTPWFGAITPFGGLAFIAGWLLLAWVALKGF